MRCAILLLLLLFACSGGRGLNTNGERMVRTELYFGLAKQHGGSVSEAEWRSFADSVAGRVFAPGFTVLTAEGAWYDPTEQRMEREPSRVLIAVHPRTRALDAAIDTLRAKYCRYFDQYAVMRLEQEVRMKMK